MRLARSLAVLAVPALLVACAPGGTMQTLLDTSADEPVAEGEAAKSEQRRMRRRDITVPETTEVAGKQPEFLLARFGEPDLRRAEPGAQFWTYTHPDCVVYFILYDEGEGVYSVHHLEADRHVRTPRAVEARLQACISDIATAYQARQSAGS